MEKYLDRLKQSVSEETPMNFRMFSSLETGMPMTALDWFYDFNVMWRDFVGSKRLLARLTKNYYFYFN